MTATYLGSELPYFVTSLLRSMASSPMNGNDSGEMSPGSLEKIQRAGFAYEYAESHSSRTLQNVQPI